MPPTSKQLLNAALGHTGAYITGVAIAGCALVGIALIKPLVAGACATNGYALCVPWTYLVAAGLRLGCSILLPTMQSMVSELVPVAQEGASASLWGIMSLVDKIANGSVIMVAQVAQKSRLGCSHSHNDDPTASNGICPYFRWVATLVPAGAAALSLVGLALLQCHGNCCGRGRDSVAAEHGSGGGVGDGGGAAGNGEVVVPVAFETPRLEGNLHTSCQTAVVTAGRDHGGGDRGVKEALLG